MTGVQTCALPIYSNGDGVIDSSDLPLTYYEGDDGYALEKSIKKAITDILRRASSGTAVSVLASGESRGANMIQGVFYPVKRYGDASSGADITWTGRMQNLWYYLDPISGNSTIREDTTQDRILKLDNDYITSLYFDTNENKAKAWRCEDSNGNNSCDVIQPAVDLEDISNLWEAGEMLFVRNPSDRKIYTNVSDDTSLDEFISPIEASTDTTTGLTVQQLLNASTVTEAQRMISFVRGQDFPGKYCSDDITVSCTSDTDCVSGTCSVEYRQRTATMKAHVCSISTSIGCTIDADCPTGETCSQQDVTNTWKLGDIIDSTPRLVSNIPNNDYYGRYKDSTYNQFYGTTAYKNRNMVLVGANDGMLHAIRLGKLKKINDPSDRKKIAKLDGKELGKEEWSFIPKNVLPYLKYLMDKDYCHLYYIDASPYVVDASIGKDPVACTATNYWDCAKTSDTWRTIIIGSMRVGGACKSTGLGTSEEVATPIADVGYSSYFALDITDNLADSTQPPKLLWEFSSPELGFSTSGPVVARIAAKDGSGNVDNSKNGRWFVILTSGPTGPIDTATHEFKGHSDQNMKIFILDLAGSGLNPGVPELVRTIDTGIANAFGNTSLDPVVDVEWTEGTKFDYQDDVMYLGYTRKVGSGVNATWTAGGLLRLLTKGDITAATWGTSTLIDGTGPVMSSIVKMRDNLNDTAGGRLWIYFGTGRYFYKTDDPSSEQRLYGIIDPCYANNGYTAGCTTTVALTSLEDSTSTISPVSSITNGWSINLDCAWNASSCNGDLAPSNYNAERVITHPLAVSLGNKAMLYFTTFSPTSDLCGYGGLTYLWAVDHATGGPPDSSFLQGKALIQVSTGEIKELNLASAFTEKVPSGETQGRRSVGFKGVPPTGQGLSVIVQPPGLKRILNMMEK